MKTLMTGTAIAALLAAGAVQAGGIDRTLNPYGVLFEDGNYAELSFSQVNPKVSGDYPALVGGGSTGDMARDYSLLSFAYKHQFTDQLSVALFQNQPYGAKAQYSQGFYTGLEATWVSDQTAAVVKYQANDNWSVYGGLRYVSSNARIEIPDALPRASFGQALTALSAIPSPTPAQTAQIAQLTALTGSASGALNYSASGTAFDGQTGYILGVAYERPEIALRVALTYESSITHKIATQENWAAPFATSGGTLNTTTEIQMPQSVKLDFQSGIAADTLAFGMIRWSEWSVWEVAPPGYFGVTGTDVTSFDNDVMTYQLGVARRFNDSLSGFARVTYEQAKGGVASRLAPTDGSTAFGVGLRITQGNVNITTGLEYVKVGDATDGTGTSFSGNDAIGFGVTVGMKF